MCRHPTPIHPDILSLIIAGVGALLVITAEIARGLGFPGVAAAVSVVAAAGLVCGLGAFLGITLRRLWCDGRC